VSRALAIAATLCALTLLAGCASISRLTASHLGPCRYDTESLEFKIGDTHTQARCLLRHVRRSGVLGPAWPLPRTLNRLVGTTDTPSKEALRRYIASRALPRDQAQAWATLAADLDKPISPRRLTKTWATGSPWKYWVKSLTWGSWSRSAGKGRVSR